MLLSGFSFAQDCKTLNIKGAVASVVEKKYDFSYNHGEYTKRDCTYQSATYFDYCGNCIGNNNGNFTHNYSDGQTSETYIVSNNEKILLRQYKYKNEKPTEILHFDKNSKNYKTEKIIYTPFGYIHKTYATDNEPISILTVNEQKKKFRIDRKESSFECTYKTDIHKPTSAKFLACRDCKRQFDKIALFKYDKNGNILRITNYIQQINVNGENLSTGTSTYDSSTKYSLRFEYEYDEFGNWTSRKCYDSSGMLIEWKERKYFYRTDSGNPENDEKEYTYPR